MEEQCKSNDRSLLEDMRLVAGMMRMGERIAFGRDADLMERAAETIVGHRYEVENLESDKDNLRERLRAMELALRTIAKLPIGVHGDDTKMRKVARECLRGLQIEI